MVGDKTEYMAQRIINPLYLEGIDSDIFTRQVVHELVELLPVNKLKEIFIISEQMVPVEHAFNQDEWLVKASIII